MKTRYCSSALFGCAVLAALSLAFLGHPRSAKADAAEDLTAGRQALAKGDLPGALGLLKSAAEALPQSVEAQLALAECHLKLGQLAEALSQYRKVLKLSPDHAAAKQVVAALSGKQRSFEESLAQAQALIDVGAFQAADQMLATAIVQPVSKEQRHTAELLLAEVRLWSGNHNAALIASLELAEESSDAKIVGPARVIAALATLSMSDSPVVKNGAADKAVSLLPPATKPEDANALPQVWQARANLVRARAALSDSTAAKYSADLATALQSLPESAFREQYIDRAWSHVDGFASDRLRRGDAAGALAMLWPAVASEPIPGKESVGKPIKISGGWLRYDRDMLQERLRGITTMLRSATEREVRLAGANAELREVWLAAELWRDHALDQASDQRLELANALAAWSRPRSDRKSGTPLSRADELQFAILAHEAGELKTEDERNLLADLILGQVQRYAAAKDVAYGLGRTLVVTDEPFDVKLSAGLADLLPGEARQKLLLGLANQAASLGAKDFSTAAATLAPTANQDLQREDKIALRLLSQVWRDANTAMQTDQAANASQAAEAIIGRYSTANHWKAALAAAELFHRGDDTIAGKFAQLQLQLRQVLSEQDRRLASHVALGAELSPEIKEILAATAKSIKDGAQDGSRTAALQLAGILVQRYQQLDRTDLALAVIDTLAGDAAVGDHLQDWALWARANIQLSQADAALGLAAKRFRGGKGLPLLEQHQAGLALLDTMITEHAKSPFFAKAVDRYLAVAGRYEKYGSYDTAQAVLTAFLEKHGKLTVAQRVQFVLVQTLVLKARADFDEQQQAKKNGEPPQALTPAHGAVLNALADFLKQYPTGDYVHGAESVFFDIARLYGQQGAWPVVRGVLSRYAAAFPNIGSPERLKLLEAATYLGELDRDYGLSLLTPPAAPEGITSLEILGGISKELSLGRWRELTAGGKWAYDGIDFEREANGKLPQGEDKPTSELAAADPFSAPAPVELTQPTPSTSSLAPGYGAAGGMGAPGPGSIPYPVNPSYGNQPRPDSGALAVIRQSQQRQSQQIALLDQAFTQNNAQPQQTAQQMDQVLLPSGAMLSEAELKRQNTAAEKAYALLIELAKMTSPGQVAVAQQARTQIFWLFGFLEGQGRPERAAEWIVRYLDDRADDPERVPLAYRALEDRLSYASLITARDQDPAQQNQAWFETRHTRFEQARSSIEKFVKEFEDERSWTDRARLLKVSSYEQEAALARGYSAVRAGGLYVQAATALLNLLEVAPQHAEAGNFPQRLWNLADQLQSLSQQDQAIYVLSQIPHRFPTDGLATQAVFRIASLYAANLHNPLKAVETYQEYLSLNGDDENVRSQIFSIAGQLANSQRYLEALHVFGVFVDSFPNDPRAAEALRQIGQTHQANEAWEEAMAAYQRILDEFPNQGLIPQVKLAIAECHINLSGWREARRLYEEFLEQFPQEGQADLAKSRIEILKNLERYQTLLADKEVERNKDDAQFQIGRIVREQLHNNVKAVEEFKKVVSGYPGSDLADDAQLETGRALLDLGRLEEARVALLEVPQKHPDSPLSDDALYLLAQSYEQQAQRLGAVTVAQVRTEAYEQGQRGAYQDFNRIQAMQLEQQRDRRSQLKKAGKSEELALDEAVNASRLNLNVDNIFNSSRQAEVVAECEIALQVANRQDRINDALREAVEIYNRVAKDHPLGDKTDDALLRIAVILETELKDRAAAMETYQKIVKLFPGTPVAEDAAWKVAKFYEQEGKYAEAAVGLRDFIRNYPASARVADAQYSLAEVYEQLGRWVDAMDAYETFRQKFGKHPKAQVAQEQINWIKAYRK